MCFLDFPIVTCKSMFQRQSKMISPRKTRQFFAVFVVCLVSGCYILLELRREQFKLIPQQNSSKNEIDVLYTWVNGSDPEFQTSLMNEIALLGKKKVSGEAAIAAR